MRSIFIRPVRRQKGPAIVPIEYLPPGAIKLSESSYRFDAIAGEDDLPRA